MFLLLLFQKNAEKKAKKKVVFDKELSSYSASIPTPPKPPPVVDLLALEIDEDVYEDAEPLVIDTGMATVKVWT